MENTKKPNYFLRITFVIFLIFIVIYVIGQSGYYEASLQKDIILTDDKIKEFEEDVLNNEVIDLKDYTIKEDKNYSNVFTNTGENISNGIVKMFSNGFSEVIKIFDFLF